MIPWALVRTFAPYAGIAIAAFGGGWWGAWSVQGVRLAGAKADLVEYKTEQQRQALLLMRRQEERAEKTRTDYAKAQEKLRGERAAHAAYRRCVESGRCLPDLPAGDGLRLPSAAGADGPGLNAVPAAAGLAADCSEVTLQLNALQQDIEAQTGYRSR